MGEPVPIPPIDYGRDCLVCTPPLGELWSSGETPDKIYAYFVGMQPCNGIPDTPPNDRTFTMYQHPDYNCIWRSEGAGVFAYLVTDDKACRITLSYYEWPLWYYFFDAYGPPCPPELSVFGNELACNGGQMLASGGVAIIHWMGVVMGLVVMMSLPSSRIMYELKYKEDTEQIVHKFCLPEYSMNVKMLMSP